MWVICVSCHRHVEKKPLPKAAKLRCIACGSRVARVVRRVKQSMLNGGQVGADEAKVLTYAGLLSIASQRGYKKAWASMKYCAIYGMPPNVEEPPPQNPSQELMWWIRKQNVEYAKKHFPRKAAEPKPQVSALMTDDDWSVGL